MKMITAELMRQLKSAAQEEIMCREVSDTSDAWQDLASPENILTLVEIALPLLEQQSGWRLVPISLTDEMIRGIVPVMARSKPISHDEYDKKGRNEHFIKWVWSVMLDLSPKPQPSTTPQIDNDGWIEWHGGVQPVSSDTRVVVRMRNSGEQQDAYADEWEWGWDYGVALDQIIAYRVIENDGNAK